MNRKISLGAAACSVMIAIAATFSVTWIVSEKKLNETLSSTNASDAAYKKLGEIESKLSQYYLYGIDSSEIPDSVGAGLAAYLKKTDKYAEYYSAEEYSEQILESSGKLVGIGVSIALDSSGYWQITGIYENSPAKEAGVQVGDMIVKVGDEDALSISSSELKSKIMGESGTSVKLTLRRESEDIEIETYRKQIDVISVTGEMLDNSIAYIKLTGFNSKTYEQFETTYKQLVEEKGAKAVVFDVRNNGGGLLDSVTKVLDKLLPEGNIVSTVDKSGNEAVYATSDAENQMKVPGVVLVNGNTASAAELFSCALRDYGLCELVGTTTKGKGVMQDTYALSDGSAIKFTTAKYNPPKSENYDGIGLTPDYTVDVSDEDELLVSGIKKEDDAQLKKALEVVNAKIS